jgi:hypothetical protein
VLVLTHGLHPPLDTAGFKLRLERGPDHKLNGLSFPSPPKPVPQATHSSAAFKLQPLSHSSNPSTNS